MPPAQHKGCVMVYIKVTREDILDLFDADYSSPNWTKEHPPMDNSPEVTKRRNQVLALSVATIKAHYGTVMGASYSLLAEEEEEAEC